MNRNYSLRYVLIVIAFFCFTGVLHIWQSDAANDRFYQASNTNIPLYHSQCANPPVVTSENGNLPPCYDFRTNIHIYWTNGHYSKYSHRQWPAGYEAAVQEEPGMTDNVLLDLKRKDISPASGIGLAEVWQDAITKIVLNGKAIEAYGNPELDFAKDSHHGTNPAVWFWGGLGVVCVVVLLATEGARNLRTGAR